MRNMADITPDPIMNIAMGFMAAKHLFVANEIGLFESLAAGHSSIAELAKKTAISPRILGIVANAMISLGLVERQGNRYSNSDVAATFLAGRPGSDLRPMVRFWNRISYPSWQKLEEAVRRGEDQAQFEGFPEEEQQIFSAGVESFSARPCWKDPSRGRHPAAEWADGTPIAPLAQVVARSGHRSDRRGGRLWRLRRPTRQSQGAHGHRRCFPADDAGQHAQPTLNPA
jgi:hypothetical protein